MLDSEKKKLNTEDSSQYNSLFIINNDFNDFLAYDEVKPEVLLTHSASLPKSESFIKPAPSSIFLSPISHNTSQLKTLGNQKVLLKKHNNFNNNTSCFLETSQISYHVANQNHEETKKQFKDKPPEEIKTERYKFQDSNSLLKALRRTLQKKQRKNPFNSSTSDSPEAKTKVKIPSLNESQKASDTLFEKLTLFNGSESKTSNEKTPQIKDPKTALEEQNSDKSPKFRKIGSNELKQQSQDKDCSEKTQTESNIEKNLKDSLSISQYEAVKEDKIYNEDVEKNEIEGLDLYFESHQFTFAKMIVPIDQSFLRKKGQNDILWSNGFEVETNDSNSSLAMKINISQEITSPFVLKVRNATENIKDKTQYNWQFGDVVNSTLFNGTMISAEDKVSGLNFNLLMLNYEKMTLLQLYDDLYKVLLIYFLSVKSQKNKTIVSISDIYYTEHLDLLENEKKFVLWVVFEPFNVRLDQIIEIRSTKNSFYNASELLYLYKEFLTDLVSLHEDYGIVYNFSDTVIFYCQAENCLKLIDLNFLFQIKNRLPHAMMTFNNLIEKLKSITDFNEDFRIAAYLKNLHTHPDKILEEVKALNSTLKRNNESNVDDFLQEIKNNERNEEKELYFHAKFLKKCFCYKTSNENYKKLLVKYEMDQKNDHDIKYKIGLNFFLMGSFEKAKGLLGYIKEIYIKNLEKYHKQVIIISLIFALISKTEKDLDSTSKHFEEVLNLLKKYEALGAHLKTKIIKLWAFCNGNLANNLSHLRKAHRLFTDALNSENDGAQHTEDIINSLAIISANLGNYEQGMNYFKQIYNDQNIATTSSSKDRMTLEKKIILLSNMALVKMEIKNYPDAKKFLEEARKITEHHPKLKGTLKIKLILHSGVLYDKMNNFYDAMKEFKLALHLFKQFFPKMKDIHDNDMKRLLFGIWTNIAGVHLKFGDYIKSQKYLEKCRKILNDFDRSREKISASCFAHNQGILNNALGKIDDAVNDIENSLKIKKKFFEENNFNIFNTTKLLFKLHLVNNNKEKALEYSEKVIEIAKKVMAENIKELFNFMQEIAETYENNNEISEAIENWEKALVFVNNEQITDSKRIECYVKLSSLYEKEKNLEKNMEINEKLIEVYNKNKDANLDVLKDLNTKMMELCKKTRKDELMKKYQLELESLKVLQNNLNLMKKVGGKFLVSLKGVKAPKKVIPMPKP